MKKFVLTLVLLLGLGLSACKKEEDFGAKDIKVYTRDSASGTREAFFEILGAKAAAKDNSLLAPSMSEVTGNSDMIAKVKGDKYGIGYISLSSLDGSGLKGLKVGGVAPTKANVLNGTYAVKRNFNYMIRSEFATPAEEYLTKAFIAYMTSVEGLGTIATEGGIVDTAGAQSWNDVKAGLSEEIRTQLGKDNSSITLKLGGSTSVEKIATALGREFKAVAGDVNVVNNHTGSGDAYKRTQGKDKDSANALHIGFLSREVKASGDEPAAAGTYGWLATDAIVVVVNEDNKLVSDVTLELLSKIFLKENNISKWKEVK